MKNHKIKDLIAAAEPLAELARKYGWRDTDWIEVRFGDLKKLADALDKLKEK